MWIGLVIYKIFVLLFSVSQYIEEMAQTWAKV